MARHLVQPNVDAEQPTTPSGRPAVTGYFPNIPANAGFGGPKTHAAPQDQYKLGPYRPEYSQDMANYKSQRMPYFQQSATWDLEGYEPLRNPGIEDPLLSGLPRPTRRRLNRAIAVQQGTDKTANQNNTLPKSPYGVQDGTTWVVRLDTVASNPRLSPYTGQSSVVRIAPAGVNGLHSKRPETQRGLNQKGYAVNPQQQSVRQNRLANSNRAGQTFSATTAYAGTPSSVPVSQRGARRGSR